MTTTQGATRDHGLLSGLDALRGLAIIAVLLAHFWPHEFPAPPAVTVLVAQFGVILFFFLSGFLMDLTYSADPRLVPFVIRRSFRILPMYWLSILLVIMTESGWTLRDVLANALFVTGPLHVARMLGVYWTLYIEVLFYAAVPVLFVLGRRAIMLSSYLMLATFGALWLLGMRGAVAPHYLVYCCLGLQFGAWRRKRIDDRALLMSVAVVVIVVTVLPWIAPHPDIVSPFLGAAPLLCAGLLYLALRVPFRIRLLGFFGEISYSLYLLHYIVRAAVTPRLLPFGYANWLVSVIVIGLCIAASVVTLSIVERPMIALGKRIIGWWRSRASRQAGVNAETSRRLR
ncbi:MAG: acyltransferase [Hyphomicrobiales bacterium]|nr:acyltransferase [Hyphomicrobiales bacterium]